MTQFVGPAPASTPPITAVYDPTGPYSWRNRINGHEVWWNGQVGRYESRNPANGAIYWWGPTPDKTLAWHLCPAPIKWSTAEFWCCLALGVIAFLGLGMVGYPLGGLIALAWFVAWGLMWSWLKTRHNMAYQIMTAAALGIAVYDGYKALSRPGRH